MPAQSLIVRSLGGVEIAAWRSGSGPPLVLVHGTTADHTRWSGVLPRFEVHFTVHAIDRRGRGASGDSPDYAIARERDDGIRMAPCAASSPRHARTTCGGSSSTSRPSRSAWPR